MSTPEYMVVQVADLGFLEKFVDQRAAEGWRCLGGVSTSVSWEEWSVGDEIERRPGRIVYAQAMTRTRWQAWIAARRKGWASA